MRCLSTVNCAPSWGLGIEQFVELNEIIQKDEPQLGYDAETWKQIQSAHFGFEIGNELLGLLFMIAEKTGFYELRCRRRSGSGHPRISARSGAAGGHEEDSGSAAGNQRG